VGKLEVYVRAFEPDVWKTLRLAATIEFGRIIQRGDEKCDIPCMDFHISKDRRCAMFEMTWEEVEELAEKLKKFLGEKR